MAPKFGSQTSSPLDSDVETGRSRHVLVHYQNTSMVPLANPQHHFPPSHVRAPRTTAGGDGIGPWPSQAGRKSRATNATLESGVLLPSIHNSACHGPRNEETLVNISGVAPKRN